MAEENNPSQPKKPADKAFQAATHGVDEAPHTHPGHVGIAKDETGRKANDAWKSQKKDEAEDKKFEEESALDDVMRDMPM
jgi:hypothetical protein